MKSFSSKRGSALLIVLGMLAFMVVSAVAFSAYMRTSRLPSSYLRRTVASRLLAKAALAEVMERLDIAIADNPYPGVGNQVLANDARYMAANIHGSNPNRNYFYRNIFIGTNGWLDAENTVSVLNLEALAYVPMSLVNEARLYSRMSPTATWHPLRFDAGRYAYTAIDVSDFFDVNRLSANLKRDSGANRISLAYLFENDDHTGYGTPSPADWDQFKTNCLKSSSYMPFVSIADLNLAMGDKSNKSPIDSPFCRYLESGTAQTFYQKPTEAKRYQQFNFVTDSYFPHVDIGEVQDLASEDGQPFSQIPEKGDIGTAKLNSDGGPFEDLSVFTRWALWDYLDENGIPLSLAIPTVEQNPMVVRIEPEKAFVVGTLKEENSETVSLKKTVHTQYKLSPAFLNQLVRVKVDLVYPFKYVEHPDAYEVDISASIFLCTSDKPRFFIERFYPDGDINKLFGAGIDKDGDIPYVFRATGSEQLSIPSTERLTDPAKAVHTLTIGLDLGELKNFFNNTPVFETKVTYDIDEDGNVDEQSRQVVEAKFNILPVAANGNLDTSDYSNNGDLAAIADRIERQDSQKVYPCVALAVRVKNKASDVDAYVDLAPAGWGCDQLNGIANPGGSGFMSPSCPLLPFVGAQAFKFNSTFFNANLSGQDAELEPKAILCKDPRYNHSVADWVPCASGEGWLDNCEVGNDGDQDDGDKDNDIFMAVSDQGYLQSVYELAFLPRLDDLPNKNKEYDYERPDEDYDAYRSTGLNHGRYWRTYKCYNDGEVDDLTNAFHVVSGSTAYKVNPYSPNLNSIMAAFANTPRNWRAASTSDMADGAQHSVEDFNKKYTLSALEWENLKELAETFQEEAQKAAQNGQSWEDAWDDLGWEETGNFLGLANVQGLHDVDRKFLYGYWRDSFANRQQLFLVFVRAEPTMMGGGAVGATPPQLGARAVALVWRDPEAAQPNQPHRMRILFYRQFE